MAVDDDELEVIVVDQSSDGRSAETAAAFGDSRLVYRRMEGKGKSRALNLGLAHARHEVVGLVDDDIEVPARWVEGGRRLLMARPRVALIFGAVRAAPHDPSQSFVPVFRPTGTRLLKSRATIPLPGLGMGANAFVRKSAVLTIGGWDEQLGPGSVGRSGDDWDLAYRLLRAGREVMVTPALEVTHSGARNYRDGSVRRLIQNNYYGIGYGLARQVRDRDFAAGVLLSSTAFRCAIEITRNVALGQRPLGARRLLSLLSGVKHACV